jgi:hypothetical protein
MRVYLCGPMTGIALYNYPAFHAEADRLRELGFIVESPAENPPPPCDTWAAYMAMSIPQMLGCDALATLDGWIRSRGAQLEVFQARRNGKRIYRARDLVSLDRLPPELGVAKVRDNCPDDRAPRFSGPIIN